jgi:ankyrin repeat protein
MANADDGTTTKPNSKANWRPESFSETTPRNAAASPGRLGRAGRTTRGAGLSERGVGGFLFGMSSGEGVGALDATAAASLLDALFSAASDVHADAAAVLADAPPTTIFLRPSPGGDGGDLETHVAVALFWGMRRRERESRAGTVGDERTAPPPEKQETRRAGSFSGEEALSRRASTSQTVVVTSRFGLQRALTATQLAFEIAERVGTDENAKGLLVDARVAPGDSGVVRITTSAYHDARRRDGFLRCKLCGRFVAGERALWWHSKTKHGITHAEAAAEAENESRALFVTKPTLGISNDVWANVRGGSENQNAARGNRARSVSVRAPSDLAAGLAAARRGDEAALAALVSSGKIEALVDPGLDAARRGDARALRELVMEKNWDPLSSRDRHGAGALLWSAGAGHLKCVRLLCEEAPEGRLPLDPNDPKTHQTGRRAYRGRTALHWAARNGHLDVVRYLVINKNVDVDRRTDEGTTAFHWAVWRGRLEVARWLVEEGKCLFAAVNTFGCNAAMWCAQGAEEDRDEREQNASQTSRGDGETGPVANQSETDSDSDSDENSDFPPTAAYVASLGVSFRPINANGHGVVHKAAQRGRRDMCAFLLGHRWPKGRDAPKTENRKPAPLDDASLEKTDTKARAPFKSAFLETPNARALVDANHLRRDDEGFRPSDLARLAGDNELHAWLVAVENAYDEEEAKAEAKQKAPPAPKRKRAPVAYALYPPTTFYGSASVGDVSLLAKILNEDVYSVNDDIAGVGSVLHVAVARGHAGLVKAILRGELANGERADVNKPSSGAFGLTPLHLAATLFARRETFARASRDLEDAEAELERLRARDRTGVGASERESRHAAAQDVTKQKKHVRREEKDALKQKKRDAHLKAAEARKVLAVEAAGALDAVRIYRLLLQAGADVEAIAKVPAKCVFAGTETAQRRETGTFPGNAPAPSVLFGAAPRDLAGAAAATELAELELEVAEAPPALFHEPVVYDETPSEGESSEGIWSSPPKTKRKTRPVSLHDPTRLFQSGVAEAEARRKTPTRAEVPGVPGAFVLEHVLGPEACASLCAFVDVLVDGAGSRPGGDVRSGDQNGFDFSREEKEKEKEGNAPAPRRESAASRAERLASRKSQRNRDGLETLFALYSRDPLSLVAATTTPDGTTHHPVEPTKWDVPVEALKEFAARCRPFLPSAEDVPKNASSDAGVGDDADRPTRDCEKPFAASLAPAGTEFATRLRCYRYDPGTASPPHFDKAGVGPVVEGRETISGYTVVVYLNGDDFLTDASASLGGETTFFHPLSEKRLSRSRRGLTWAVGDGAAPLTRVSARVRGRTGAALFFPHGTVSGCFESPLHEGSAVSLHSDAAKYVLRSDVYYLART